MNILPLLTVFSPGRFGGKEGIFPACFVPAIPDHWNIPEDSETFTENFGEPNYTLSLFSNEENDNHFRLLACV